LSAEILQASGAVRAEAMSKIPGGLLCRFMQRIMEIMAEIKTVLKERL
jgi:hypothetical protein